MTNWKVFYEYHHIQRLLLYFIRILNYFSNNRSSKKIKLLFEKYLKPHNYACCLLPYNNPSP